MIYYVYECVPHLERLEGLITVDKKHWWGINCGLLEAVKYISICEGWEINKDSCKPGKLLYTSETHPELFL